MKSIKIDTRYPQNIFEHLSHLQLASVNGLEIREQTQQWNQLESGFTTLIEKESKTDSFDFEKVYAMIRSYDDEFKKLPIEGKVYVRIHKRLLTGQLLRIVKDFEYLKTKEIENPDCECELLSRFGKEPNTDHLKEIGVINDSYYMPKLLKCNRCDFLWNSYILDDSTGKLVFEKHNPKDDHLIRYHC